MLNMDGIIFVCGLVIGVVFTFAAHTTSIENDCRDYGHYVSWNYKMTCEKKP